MKLKIVQVVTLNEDARTPDLVLCDDGNMYERITTCFPYSWDKVTINPPLPEREADNE